MDALLIAMRDDVALPQQARAQAGDWLARLGDPCPGMSPRTDGSSADGLPDIA